VRILLSWLKKIKFAGSIFITPRKSAYWIGLLASLPFAAAGQRLEAAGASISLNVTQTKARPYVIPTGYYTLYTNADYAEYDDLGYRLAAYVRWQIGQSSFFVQPELGYTSSRGQTYQIASKPDPRFPFPDFEVFSPIIRRGELAALAGWHTGRHTYLMAGPVLAINQREAVLDTTNHTSLNVYNSLNQSVIRVQLLGQVGVGVTFGRFDFNLRLEQSLTPYSNSFILNGTTYSYRQQIRQGLATAGFLLYKAKPQPAPGREQYPY